jgi:DNA-directed RNA polymerase specialized sigma subunit
MRYFNDEFMSWQEIGKKMDLSTQAVINLHDKAKDLLQTKLTSDTILDIV